MAAFAQSGIVDRGINHLPTRGIVVTFWRLLPGICVLCQSYSDRAMDLCRACAADLRPNIGACPRCAIPTPARDGDCPACQVAPPPYARAVVPYLYVPPLTRVIHGLKHGNGLIEARILAALMADALILDGPPDVIVPVPLTYRRRIQRGYNQAALLAAQIARAMGTAPVDYRGLKRIRHAAPQRSLDAAARRRNQLGAYRASPNFVGKDIAVVDDVMTTGATAAEVSATLLDAGAATVRIWAAARTLAT